MGPISIIYIAFASIALYASILQLFISCRKRMDKMFLISSILSLVVFIHFAVLVLCTTPFGIKCPPFTLLKIQLIFIQVVAICMLVVLFRLLSNVKRTYILINISLLGLLTFVSLFIPEHVLFGEKATINYLSSNHGDQFPLIGNGFTFWRAIKDLTILIFVVSAFLVLIKKLNDVSFRTIAWLFGGVGIVLFAAVFDQCIDLGQIHSAYLLPFAIFTFYIILIFIPFAIFIRETIAQQNFILQEKRWQNLINQADLIVVDLNRMGVVESINPFFYTLTGFSEEEVIGKDWFEFFIPPKEYYNVQGAFVEVLESEFHPQYLNPILTKNKDEKMIRWFNVRTHDQQGKIKGSLSIGVDVSEETREKEILLKKLNDAEKLIKELNKKANTPK